MSTLDGSLEALSLAGLLQLLSAEGRTGRLDLQPSESGAPGRLWLADGRVLHAETEAGTSGEDAVHELLLTEAGHFTFEGGVEPPASTVSASTDLLLMEAACRRDHQLRAEGPVGVDDVPALAPVPDGGTTPRFNTLQWKILASIDGQKSVRSLAAEIEVPAERLAALIGDLVRARVLELRAEAGA